MEQQGSCPICTRKYTKIARREMNVCLSQHFLCLECAEGIAKKNSLCPFCKRRFDIAEIQPRRMVRESAGDFPPCQGFCPKRHSFGKFTTRIMTCEKCKEASRAQWQCYTCHYTICKECIESQDAAKGQRRDGRKEKPEPIARSEDSRRMKKTQRYAHEDEDRSLAK